MSETTKPRVSVGAVVFKGDAVLLIKRGRPPFKGQWSIPGGGVEYGERLVDAVKREVMEETGVEVDVLRLIDAFEALPGEQPGANDRHNVMIDYVCRWTAGEPRAGDDAADAAWAPLDEAMERLAWDETRRAIQMAAALLKAGAVAGLDK
ncbi:MAG: NUDIX hydrolase [Pseudomonadota bacterium]